MVYHLQLYQLGLFCCQPIWLFEIVAKPLKILTPQLITIPLHRLLQIKRVIVYHLHHLILLSRLFQPSITALGILFEVRFDYGSSFCAEGLAHFGYMGGAV